MCALVQYAAIVNWCFYIASIYKYISPKAAHGSPGDNFLSQQTNLENVCLTTAKEFGKSPFSYIRWSRRSLKIAHWPFDCAKRLNLQSPIS